MATRTRLVNHVRGTIKSFGDRIPKCRAETFVRHTRDLVPELLKPALGPIYEALEAIEKQIRDQDQPDRRVRRTSIPTSPPYPR